MASARDSLEIEVLSEAASLAPRSLLPPASRAISGIAAHAEDAVGYPVRMERSSDPSSPMPINLMGGRSLRGSRSPRHRAYAVQLGEDEAIHRQRRAELLGNVTAS